MKTTDEYRSTKQIPTGLTRAARLWLLAFSAWLMTAGLTAAPEKYKSMGGVGFTDYKYSFYKYLTNEAFKMLDERDRKVSAINSREGWLERQQFVRKQLDECMGPFPERTPLNARVTSVIRREGYRVEQVIFESLPRYYVTASLYVPDGAKKNHKTPAILFCSGHGLTGRMTPAYKTQMQNFARKGFIVLAFDPIGQGERIQYLREDGHSSIFGPTAQHSYPGTQMLLCGYSVNRYMIWDGIRAIDYLISRKEVDPQRIGITGRSGGGTQSALIAAYDERLAAASPENFLTTYKRLLQTSGPQDAEQNIYQFIAHGLDETDFIMARAPRPYMMITTTNDMFNIQGAKDIEAEMKRVYQAMGHTEDFQRVEDLADHRYTKKNNESNYAFYSRHFQLPCDTVLEQLEEIPDSQLYATPSGQVYTSLGGETLFSLNLKVADSLMVKIKEQRRKGRAYFATVASQARQLAGYREPQAAHPVLLGSVKEDGYQVDRYVTQGEGDYHFPYVIYRPQNPSGEFAIYLHESGKGDSTAIHDEIEPMIRRGVSVLAPDLLGYGEMAPGTLPGDAWIDGVSHNLLYLSNLIGRSLLAVRSADLVSLVRMVRQTETPRLVTGVAHGEMASIMLHAAAFATEIDRVVLTGDICSFYSICATQRYDSHIAMNIVPAALTAYDLPDLAASLAPRPLSIVTLPGYNYKNSTPEQLQREGEVLMQAYREAGASDHLKLTDQLQKCF